MPPTDNTQDWSLADALNEWYKTEHAQPMERVTDWSQIPQNVMDEFLMRLGIGSVDRLQELKNEMAQLAAQSAASKKWWKVWK